MCFYTTLLGFYYGTSQLATFLQEIAFPIFELGVHVLTFSFENDQFTSLTNQKIVIYVGQSSGTAEILPQGLTC